MRKLLLILVLTFSFTNSFAACDSQTSLMLHANGTDASTSFPDSSVSVKTVTANGDAQVDTAQLKFGSGSLLCDGTGDYLSSLDNVDFEIGAGDFTFDFWVRFNSTASDQAFISKWAAAGTRSYILRWITTNALELFVSTDGTASTNYQFSWTPSTATWYHVAFVRTGTTLRAFIDGTQIGADATESGTFFDGTADLQIGIFNTVSNPFNGWIDELRISKGIARWTGNFTPPTSAYCGAASSTDTMFQVFE